MRALPDGLSLSPLTPDPDLSAPLRIVTFHTSGPQGGGYEHELTAWMQSLGEFGYENCAIAIDAGNVPTWRRATFLKGIVVSWACRYGKTLWLDVDARVRGPLTLFEDWSGEDIGIRKFNSGWQDWCSGTVFVNDTFGGRKIAERWGSHGLEVFHGKGDYKDLAGDQDLIGFLLMEEQDVTIRDLPVSHCFIFDIDRHHNPGVEPVIEHFQASRRRLRGPRGGQRCQQFR